MKGRLGIAAALAALMSGGGGGASLLTDMFTPRFHFGAPYRFREKKRKHRAGGKGSPRPNSHTDWNVRGRTDARQTLRDQRNFIRSGAKFWPGIDHHARRMEWLARNQHVIAKRAEQQETGKVVWGRN